MTDRIHVCILTTGHAIDDTRVYHKVARSFSTAGMRVSWVGPEFSLYGRLPSDQELPISWHLYPRGQGRLERLFRCRSAWRTARDLSDIDVYYCPDPDSGAVGWRLAKKLGGRVILDIHENYQTPLTVGQGAAGLRRRSFGPLVQQGISFICRQCDIVMGVSEFVLSPYMKAIRESLVIRNCAPRWFFDVPAAETRVIGVQPFTLMHGTGALARGTDVVLEAVALAKRRVDRLSVIVFNAFTESADGYGEQAFRRRMDQLQVAGEIDFRESIPLRSVPGVLQTCNAGLIGYGRSLGVGSLPNRLFEYMASGLAVIAPSYAVEIKKIVEAEQCGLLVDFEDPEAVADAIAYLYDHPDECQNMGARARTAFEQRHNWETEFQPLLDRVHQWLAV